MKRTDEVRVGGLIYYGNDETERLANWIYELVEQGNYNKASRILRVAERMMTKYKRWYER